MSKEQINNEQEKPIQKMELVFHHLGRPDATFGIRINGRMDDAFFFGAGKLLENVSPEKLCEIFPYAFEMTEAEGKKKFKPKRNEAFKILEDQSGIQKLTQILDIPIDIVKEDVNLSGGGRQKEDNVERYTIAPSLKE